MLATLTAVKVLVCNVVYDVPVDVGARRYCCTIIICDDRHGSFVWDNDDESGRL